MKHKPMHIYLHERLREMTGKQSQISRDTGIGQASISRIARGEQIPSVVFAEKLNAWLKRHDKQEAMRSKNSPQKVNHPSSISMEA